MGNIVLVIFLAIVLPIVLAGNTIQSAGRASSGSYQTVGTFVIDAGVGQSASYTLAPNLNQGQPASPVIPVVPTPTPAPSGGGGGGGGGGSFFGYVSPGNGGGGGTSTPVVTPAITPSATVGGAAALLLPPNSLLPRNLSFSTLNPSVKVLQKFLNNNGFFLGWTGPGSPGNETNKFSTLTRNAISGFQKLYGPTYGFISELGTLGTKTRAFINSLLTKKITLIPQKAVVATQVKQTYVPLQPQQQSHQLASLLHMNLDKVVRRLSAFRNS